MKKVYLMRGPRSFFPNDHSPVGVDLVRDRHRLWRDRGRLGVAKALIVARW